MELEHLVLDTGAIIKGQTGLWKIAKNIWTVDGVFSEIRDSKSRALLETLPYEIKMKSPSAEAVKAVIEFSKKSGDFAALSKTDIGVIALLYTLECEYSGIDHIRREPVAQLKALVRMTENKNLSQSSVTSSPASSINNSNTWTKQASEVTSLNPCCSGVVPDGLQAVPHGHSHFLESEIADAPNIDVGSEFGLETETEPTAGLCRNNQDENYVHAPSEGLSVASDVMSHYDANLKTEDDIEDYEEDEEEEEGDGAVEGRRNVNDSLDEDDDEDEDEYEEDDCIGDDIDGHHNECESASHQLPHSQTPAQDSALGLTLDDSSFPALASTQLHSSSTPSITTTTTTIDANTDPASSPSVSWAALVSTNDPAASASSSWTRPLRVKPTMFPVHLPVAPTVTETVQDSMLSQDSMLDTEDVHQDSQPSLQSRILNNLTSSQSGASDFSSKQMAAEDDGENWINERNVQTHRAMGTGSSFGGGKGMAFQPNAIANNTMKVACITTDFTMQNVCLQMNLGLCSLDGMAIKSVRQWVLRCGACFKVHYDMERLFCSKCGSSFMQRIAASIDRKSGELKLHLRKNYQPNTRGMIYSLPKPGQQSRFEGEVLLREDQLKSGIWRQKVVKIQKDVRSAFGEDITGDLGVHINKSSDIQIGLGRQNPNAKKGRERRGKKK